MNAGGTNPVPPARRSLEERPLRQSFAIDGSFFAGLSSPVFG